MPGQALVIINENQWSVEVASSATELITGLAGVASIPAGTGMLFVLPARQLVTVDTTEMLFPIDIIFIKDDAVLDIARNIQPGYLVEEATPIDMFLEVNALEAATIEVGDTVSITITQAPGTDWSSMISNIMPLAMFGIIFGLLGGMLSSGSPSSKKQLGSDNPKGNVVLSVVKVPETEEYKVKWVENGKYIEAKSYYTDDLEDAKATFIDTISRAQRSGYDVRVAGDRFIPDMFKDLEEGKTKPIHSEPKAERREYQFICPKCGARSKTNIFGDILDKQVKQDHPYISTLGARVCLANYRGPWRWEALSKQEQEKYIIRPVSESHSIHGEPRVRLVEKYGSWAVGRAEAICPEDDIECVTREAERLIETLRSRHGETAMKYVTIVDPFKTVFHVGDVVSIVALEGENKRVRALGEKEATWQ